MVTQPLLSVVYFNECPAACVIIPLIGPEAFMGWNLRHLVCEEAQPGSSSKAPSFATCHPRRTHSILYLPFFHPFFLNHLYSWIFPRRAQRPPPSLRAIWSIIALSPVPACERVVQLDWSELLDYLLFKKSSADMDKLVTSFWEKKINLNCSK